MPSPGESSRFRSLVRVVGLALVSLAVVAGPTATGATALPAAAGAQQARVAAGGGPVPDPVVEGPITGGVRGYPWNHTIFPLTTPTHDYSENEFFYSGTATDLSTGNTAAYKSRMLVRFPKDPAKFNGTVLFDWMNVTDQQDYEFNWWSTAYEELMNAGYGYVAVSAQQIGGSTCSAGIRSGTRR